MISHSTKGTQIMTSFLHRFAGALLLAGVIVHAQITLTSESTPVLHRTLTLVCQLHNQLINDTIFFFRHIGPLANTTINITCDQRQNFGQSSRTLYTVCSPDQTARKLVIEFVNSDVEGAWTCGQEENISNSLTVDLLVAPQWPAISVRDGLYFDAVGNSVVGKLGFRLSLECRYYACVLGDCNRVTEPLNVTWSRFDQFYQNPIALPPQANITDQYLANTSVLVLDPLNRNDSGVYKCDSINEVGATSDTMTVNILVEPSFVRVLVGESFFDRWVNYGINGATCSSDYHYPPSKVKLIFTQHGDPPIEFNMSQMTFGVEMLQWRVDYGYYLIKGDRWISLQCRLNYTDMFGRQTQLTSDVMTLPSYPVVAVKIDDGLGGAMNGTYREGGSVIMTCTATDDHPPDTTPYIMQYKWNIDSLNAQIKNLTETSSQLRISNLTVLDSGRYECCAQNAVAQRCIAQNIDVQYAPRAFEAMNVQQTVGVGDSVTYYIRISANPPDISNAAFTRADTQAQSRFVMYMRRQEQYYEKLYLFNLVHVLDADYGEYIFTATNAVGQLTQSFLLVRPTTQNAPPQTIPTTQNAPPQTIPTTQNAPPQTTPTTRNAPPQTTPTTQNAPPQTTPTTQNAPPQTTPTTQNAPPRTIPTATAEMLAIISLAGLAVLTLAMVIMFIILIRLTCYIKNNPNLQKDDTQESRMKRYLENNVVESMQ